MKHETIGDFMMRDESLREIVQRVTGALNYFAAMYLYSRDHGIGSEVQAVIRWARSDAGSS